MVIFLITFGLFNVYTVKQISRAKSYSKAFDKLIIDIKSDKRLENEYILTMPLPNPGVISYASFSKLSAKDTSLTSYYFCKVLNRNSLLVTP